MNLQTQKFASKSHLRHYQPLKNRITMYKCLMKQLEVKNLDVNKYCLVIIQRFNHGKWTDQIYYVPKFYSLLTLYKRILPESKQVYYFNTPKIHTQMMGSKNFEYIYQNFKDTDDNIIYLELHTIKRSTG